MVSGVRLIGAIALLLVWLVLASWLLCFLVHLDEFHLKTFYLWTFWPDTFVWPYDQWWEGLGYIGVNGRFDLYMEISAVVPALLLGFLGVALVIRLRAPARSLYGKSRWATRQEMRKEGIQ